MVRKVLRNDQWTRIAEMLPGKASDPGRTAADNRMFVEAVLWIARTGSPWRDLPEPFGPWNSVYQRFARWSKKGVWHRVFAALAEDADFEEVFLDSTIVRAHQHAAGAKKNGPQALGRSRGGLTTKIHALVEGLGNLARWTLTPGQAHDLTQAVQLLEDITAAAVVADKAYDADALVEQITHHGGQAVIPPRANRIQQRPFDTYQYRDRNLIERFFCRLKQFRRIATRYDKLAQNFSSFIAVAAMFVWLA
ncbi:MAG: IS5 family transposase [Gammaproteobacteria bacterium]